MKLNVERFTQEDNVNKPMVTCYPTSNAMVINHCLKQIGLDRTALGCPKEKQLEDFVYEKIMSPEMRTWTTVHGERWMISYMDKLYLTAPAQVKIFNDLMNQYGFKSDFCANVSYDKYMRLIDEQELPQILFGDFSSISVVGGHMVVGVGYDKNWNVFVNDPYGDAATSYQSKDGKDRLYGWRFFTKDAYGNAWVQRIIKL